MNKPSGYDETRASGEFIPPEVGGHYCQIVQVRETKTQTGKDQIVVLFDFCSPDKQAGMFKSSFENDTRPKDEKKWPFAGSKWIIVNDYEDASKTSRAFKTFCSCVESSNNYEIKWGGSDWEKQFKGKKIGAVFGEEENEYNGKTTMRSQLRYFCSWDYVSKAKVPDPKYLSNRQQSTGSQQSNDFMNIPDGSDEEIPF